MKYFHAHTYFAPEQLDAARAFHQAAVSAGIFKTIKFHEHPIGPHPSGMVETHFSEDGYEAARQWHEQERGLFTVLIHEDTGNDYDDHTKHALWLGEPVALDFSFFDLIVENPDLRINK